MSELNPLNGGKKSKILEERRLREEREQQRIRKQERERRNKKRKRQQIALISIFTVFTAVCLVCIAILLGKMLITPKTEDGSSKKAGTEETTAPQVVSNSVDLSKLAIDESMYMYDNDPEMLQALKDRLYSSETEDERLQFIIEHQAAYPPAMIEFLVKYEEVLDFVLKYPVEIEKEQPTFVDISAEYVKGEVPTFIQWDDRWGYIEYGDNVIGDSGCGPTCLAMAVVALTGKTQYTPIALCRFATQNGYYVDGVGSSWDLMLGGAKKLGLSSKQISISEDSIKSSLDDGKLVILSMGPGIFTKGGHFILVYKYENGKFYVKDPNSKERSDTGFTYKQISDQIKGGWALGKEEKKK